MASWWRRPAPWACTRRHTPVPGSPRPGTGNMMRRSSGCPSSRAAGPPTRSRKILRPRPRPHPIPPFDALAAPVGAVVPCATQSPTTSRPLALSSSRMQPLEPTCCRPLECPSTHFLARLICAPGELEKSEFNSDLASHLALQIYPRPIQSGARSNQPPPGSARRGPVLVQFS